MSFSELALYGDAPVDGLSEDEIVRLAALLDDLFCAQARAYTMGDSGSLPACTATELMASLLYTLDVSPAQPQSLRPLLHADCGALLVHRRSELLRRKEQARALAAQLCLTAPRLGCIALRDTLQGILRGLERYDAQFFAHRVPGDIDYQLLSPVPESLQGVDYVLEYLARLNAELRFLNRFPLHRVLALLDGMSSRWRELLCNLSAPVASNAMGLLLLDADPRRLHLSGGQRDTLLALLSSMTDGEIEHRLLDCSCRLSVCLELTDERSAALLSAHARDLAPGLTCAVRKGDLSHVFFSFGLPRECRRSHHA